MCYCHAGSLGSLTLQRSWAGCHRSYSSRQWKRPCKEVSVHSLASRPWRGERLFRYCFGPGACSRACRGGTVERQRVLVEDISDDSDEKLWKSVFHKNHNGRSGGTDLPLLPCSCYLSISWPTVRPALGFTPSLISPTPSPNHPHQHRHSVKTIFSNLLFTFQVRYENVIVEKAGP